MKKKLSSQQLALKYIFEAKGGVHEVGRMLGFNAQTVHNWIVRGKVPLILCGYVSDALGCTKRILNFEEVTFFMQAKDEWEDVVDGDYFISPVDKDSILSSKHPKRVKDILNRYGKKR